MQEEQMLLRAGEADKLLASADGTAALLYLHILRDGGLSVTKAARVLRCSEAEITLAAETLRRLGLFTAPTAPLPAETLPELTARDLHNVASVDGAFRSLVDEAEQTLGRVLSENDMRILFGLYDHLGLPADVIMLLLHHCIEEYQLRSGPGRMPTMRFVEKEGWSWAGKELLNLDAAERYLRSRREQRAVTAQVKEALGIRGRSLTPSERSYIESWIAMGFGTEAVAMAYDRTVLRTGKLTWKYMDSILKSWDSKHLYTPEQIDSGDPAKRTKRPAALSDADKLDHMRKLYDHMKKPGGGREA